MKKRVARVYCLTIPKRLVNQPIKGKNIASETAYDVITQVPWVGATAKSPAIWVKDTFTIDEQVNNIIKNNIQ